MDIRLSQASVVLPSATTPLFRIPKFQVASGSKVLIHGPSGRGKTTLLHLMAGLLLPSEGDVFVGDQNLRFLSDEQRCQLRRKSFGMVFQRLNLLDHLTALENVQLTAPHGTAEEKAREALAKLGMSKFAGQTNGLLESGEQQRIAVARVLLAQPRIILADEPTSSLDSANAEAVADALLNLPGAPTLVVVSHDARIRSGFSTSLDFEELTRS